MNRFFKFIGSLFSSPATSEGAAPTDPGPGETTAVGETVASAAAKLVLTRGAKLTADQEKIKAAIIGARLLAQATAPTKIVRFVDSDGQVVWISGLSPQDAERNIDALTQHGYTVLGVLDITSAPRRPTWPIEYEDPQCYNARYVEPDDLSNHNLGTVELREQLIAEGKSLPAVLRATSARYSGPLVFVH